MKDLAARYHHGQFRKGKGNIPYIVHPQAVAEALIAWGEPAGSSAIAIAWGHDLLEDTEVTEEQIAAVGSKEILDAVKLLTRPRSMDKALYLRNVAYSQNRSAILVKIADRICNSEDFIELENKLYALHYLHEADCLFKAAECYKDDEVMANAIKAWHALDDMLSREGRREALRGSLLGGAVGDALGAPVEFLSKEEIISKYGPAGVTDYVEFPGNTGAITDDTQMTLFTAEGILRAYARWHERGICAPEAVVKNAYLRWLKTQGITVKNAKEDLTGSWLCNNELLCRQRAPGMTCIAALEENDPHCIAQNDSKGCGTVMRMAPAGLFFDPEEAYQTGCDFSAITHGHPTGITAGGAFAMLTAFLLQGKSLDKSLDLTEEHLGNFYEAEETLNAIKKARNAGDITELGEGWVAEEALSIAVYCALKYQHDFSAGVLAAVNISGDSDSTGAITGNILGLINGEKAIPRKWLNNLREYEVVSEMADDLYKKFEAAPGGWVSDAWWNKYPGA